ncbi:MAG: DEAD/DEAH box helicase, partial [Armatimonadota bacterium]
HLALSLERLVQLCGRDFVRIGLSATQKPLELVARFLGGQRDDGTPRPVNVVDAGGCKAVEVSVGLPAVGVRPTHAEGGVWAAVAPEIADLVEENRSVLVFTNARRSAERLAFRVNLEADREIAFAHHGSVSKERRLLVEQALKDGRLPCVVATSSLELGIDIGSVDMVVQVQSPKSVSQALQRVGRAGHRVTAVSRGRFIATHMQDLLEMAVVVRAMLNRDLERVSVPEGCLDVLAQQIVAMACNEEWKVADLLRCVRRAYPYRNLTQRQLEAVLDMLAGRFAFASFKELSPRVVWDPVNGVVRGRPGARLVAVTSGGTIPDRGYYGMYLTDRTTKLGELDEEFVFERRVGDCFQLGTSTWRIEAITADRVIVSPHYGAPGMMPFWRGEYQARSYDLSLAVGRLCRELSELSDEDAAARLVSECRMDGPAAKALVDYVRRQERATKAVPSDRCVVLEQCRDEHGDTKLIVHSLFGGRVNAAWSLVLTRELRRLTGVDVQCVYSDDAVVFHTTSNVDLAVIEAAVRVPPGTAEQVVVDELSGSTLFGARFRENAARTLLLTKPRAGRRQALWVQRMRAKDLLDAIRRFPEFPVTIETYRECLKDHLDINGLRAVLSGIESGEISLVSVGTAVPSPFASAVLWQYANEYLYDDDTPRRGASVSVNHDLLGELVGSGQLSQLLNPQAIARLEEILQRTSPERRARTPDELHDLLLAVGDLSCEPRGESELDLRCSGPADELAAALEREGRALRIVLTPEGDDRLIAAEDWPLYRDAFGLADRDVRLPESLAERRLAQEHALAAVLTRFLRNRGPVSQAELERRYCGRVPRSMVAGALEALRTQGDACSGHFVNGLASPQWCSTEVLEQVRRMSLALQRREVKPCTAEEYTRFLLRWQYVSQAARVSGLEGLEKVLGRLHGACLPAELWERDVLPARIDGYTPRMMDELCVRGTLAWAGDPECGAGWVALMLRELEPQYRCSARSMSVPSVRASLVMEVLQRKGAFFFGDLLSETGLSIAELTDALWELVWLGLATNDSFEALRAGIRSGFRAPVEPVVKQRPPAPLFGLGRRALRRVPTRRPNAGSGVWIGRWALTGRTLAQSKEDAAEAAVEAALNRYGIVVREVCALDPLLPSWGAMYAVLQRLEFAGVVRRGYFVQGLSGAQFAVPEAVDTLNAVRSRAGEREAVLLNSYDPANPYGASRCFDLPRELAVQRSPETYVVILGGRPVLAAEASAQRIAVVQDAGEDELRLALSCLPRLVAGESRTAASRRGRRRLELREVNGEPVLGSRVEGYLSAIGFVRGPKGMTLWG